MKVPKFVVAGLVLIFALSLFTVFAQATPVEKQEPKKQEQPQRSGLPKEIKAIIQEGLTTRQGRQDIPFTIFKSLAFPLQGGMHAVIFFKAKNADLGYAAPTPVAPAKNAPAQPVAPAAGVLEARLAIAVDFFQTDAAGVQKSARDTTFSATLQTDSANYDPNKEEWYSLGFGLPYGKYTLAVLLAPMDPKKGGADTKKVGVAYYDLTLPGPETYAAALDTTSLFLARTIEQMPTYEARPLIHRGFFTYSVLQIAPNIDSVVTAEDKGLIEVFFFVLGAKAKDEPPAQPKYDIEINFEVQKEDGSAAIKWQTKTFSSPLIDQSLPLKRTLKTGEKTEQKDLDPGKYTLVIKIKDLVSGLTLEKKTPFEVK